MNTNKYKVYHNKTQWTIPSKRRTTRIIPHRRREKSRKAPALCSTSLPNATVCGLPSFSPAVSLLCPLTDAFQELFDNFPTAAKLIPAAKLTPQRLTLLSARQLLLGHKPQGKVEQKASMVPYQEVQGTSQTPCVGSRAGSQPGSSNAPPAGLIWSHRLDAAAAAGAEPSLQDCPHTTWATGLRVVPASYGVQENPRKTVGSDQSPNQNVIHVLITIIDQIINHRAACNFHISFFTLFILMFVTD